MTANSMPWWHPDGFAARRPRLEARAAMLAAIRDGFRQDGFLEVETPALQVSPGLEPHLRAFRTAIEDPFGGAPRTLHLHTSPEFAMKKLLVAGVPRLFQFARVFRNGERSATHHPEFTMLEWYRAEPDWRVLVDDCRRILGAAWEAVPAALRGKGGFAWREAVADPLADWEMLSVAEAFDRHAGVDIVPLLGDAAAFAAAARAIGVAAQPHDRWDDVFFRIFLDRIEPRLGIGAPTVLYAYPAEMAALSRLDPADPRFAQRFEVYVCGLELANAFAELTDAAEQRRRFEADMDLKQALYGERYPIDEDFLAALSHGMPASVGIALGFDRLAMLATGAASIEQVLWAPVA
ncbi:lysyl-tRNA synthetase class 2 [Constrictibacter sp. MBR-5]|jgi:lysyl-tRNA synthetase class 2|uniref:EF-P lysine aminoacylase EpmA n=1 Tax=Constrictibacter sp. MBR-5 TaxID=3156467 RepID=UPI0033946D9D